jgi:hypothetical protein
MFATRKYKEIYDMQARRKATWFNMQKLVVNNYALGCTRYPSQVPSNHVRDHAAHDHEHGCYNSFTLCRGCTGYP